jgi:hypothetical protein
MAKVADPISASCLFAAQQVPCHLMGMTRFPRALGLTFEPGAKLKSEIRRA